jgi:hypothetical protein
VIAQTQEHLPGMQEVSGSVYHDGITNGAIADKRPFWARFVRGIPDA